jgi:hypothetical protein
MPRSSKLNQPGAFLDVVVLHLEEARLCPLAVRAVAPASHDGFELVLAEIVRDLVVNGALGTGDRFDGAVQSTRRDELLFRFRTRVRGVVTWLLAKS